MPLLLKLRLQLQLQLQLLQHRQRDLFNVAMTIGEVGNATLMQRHGGCHSIISYMYM